MTARNGAPRRYPLRRGVALAAALMGFVGEGGVAVGVGISVWAVVSSAAESQVPERVSEGVSAATSTSVLPPSEPAQ